MAVQTFVTEDVDEANAVSRDTFFNSHIEPTGNSSSGFRFGMQADTVGPLTYARVSHGCEISGWAGGRDLTYSVVVPLMATFDVQFGSDDVPADPFSAFIMTPTSRVKVRGFRSSTERLFVLSFGKESLSDHLRGLLGDDRPRRIDFKPSLDLRRGFRHQWWRMTSKITLGALNSPDGLATNPMMTAPLADMVMTGLLLAADHPYRDALDAWVPPAPPSLVRRAIDIIEQRAHEPLTVGEIAAEAGCSVRTLQVSFKMHLNATPSDYLRRARMDRVHTMLMSADPEGATVAGSARSWGFNHVGRFEAQYREIYGVLPRVTLEQ